MGLQIETFATLTFQSLCFLLVLPVPCGVVRFAHLAANWKVTMTDESDSIPRINVEHITTEGGNYHVIVLEPQSAESTVPIIFVAPITWAWVALQICAGILQAIGGAIFSAVFGKAGVTKQDLRDLLEQFVAVIEAVIRQQIQLDKKEEIEASAASLQSLFNMYLNNKDTTYLTPLIFKADDLVYQSARLRLLAVGCFAVVASLELAIIQEESLAKKTDGHKKNIVVKAN